MLQILNIFMFKKHLFVFMLILIIAYCYSICKLKTSPKSSKEPASNVNESQCLAQSSMTFTALFNEYCCDSNQDERRFILAPYRDITGQLNRLLS